jgi:hypothetical protein
VLHPTDTALAMRAGGRVVRAGRRRMIHSATIMLISQAAAMVPVRLDGVNESTARSQAAWVKNDHRYDQRAWVKALLGVAEGHEEAAVTDGEPGQPTPVAWELVKPADPDLSPLAHRLMRALSQRIQWRNAINAAKDRAAQLGNTAEATETEEREEREA